MPTTSDAAGAEPDISSSVLPTASRRVRRHRVLKIVREAGPRLAPIAVRRAAGRDVPAVEFAKSLESTFAALGATYVKFGQLAASAPGVFGPEVSEEFRRLLDSGPPVPFSHVRREVERVCGGPLEASYSTFETEPIGRASIAVVHRARLPSGEVVAVKVVRPGIAQTVAADLAIMRRVVSRLARRAGGQAHLVGPMLDGLGQQIAEEIDLRNEAAAMDRFRLLLDHADLPLVTVPAVHHELSGRAVLTMEFLDGVPIDDLATVTDFGFDPQPLVDQVVRAWFMTAVRDGVFHGDVHAGNLMLLRDGRIGVIDWGIVGRLTPATHDHLRSVIAAALGDESAWDRVTAYITAQVGPMLADRLGLSADQMPAFIRSMIGPLLTRPFGEVELSSLLLGAAELRSPDAAGNRPRGKNVTIDEVPFDRGMVLLSKQLLYFERYGRMYLADQALLSDREFFAALLNDT